MNTIEIKTSKKPIAPINCLVLEMKDARIIKLWLEMEIKNKRTYCVVCTNISKKKKRINIEKEMGEFVKKIGII